MVYVNETISVSLHIKSKYPNVKIIHISETNDTWVRFFFIKKFDSSTRELRIGNLLFTYEQTHFVHA